MSKFEDCDYFQYYINIHTNESCEYKCNRKRMSKGKCIFHDPDYLTSETKEEVLEILKKEIATATKDDTPLLLIGCNLPVFMLRNKKFKNDVYFASVNFKDVTFKNIEFSSISFNKSNFYGESTFLNIEILENLNFSQVKFDEKTSVNFSKVTGLKFNNFFRTIFDKFEMINCTFNDSQFRYAIFKNKSLFTKVIFSNNADFSGVQFQEETKFDNIYFQKQNLINFHGDLSTVSFKETDITRIKFDGKTIWGKLDKYQIWDDIALRKNSESSHLSSVLAIYRNLRENYEFRLMYEEASEFYIKEMDLRRFFYEDPNDRFKTKQKTISRYFSLINCYNLLCQYGESLKRIFLWAISLISISFIYFFVSMISFENTKEPEGIIEYLKYFRDNFELYAPSALNKVLFSFLQSNLNNFAENIVKVSGMIIIGLFFITIRRKFERRFRH